MRLTTTSPTFGPCTSSCKSDSTRSGSTGDSIPARRFPWSRNPRRGRVWYRPRATPGVCTGGEVLLEIPLGVRWRSGQAPRANSCADLRRSVRARPAGSSRLTTLKNHKSSSKLVTPTQKQPGCIARPRLSWQIGTRNHRATRWGRDAGGSRQR